VCGVLWLLMVGWWVGLVGLAWERGARAGKGEGEGKVKYVQEGGRSVWDP
jgi:hypothetical protein